MRFNLPFDATTLENLLLKLDPGRSGTRRTGSTSRQQAAMDFGGPLFEAVFREGLLLAWTRSHDVAREQDSGLRLRLRMGAAPALAGLPWELLYDARSNCFLAQSERTPLVRFLDVPNVARPISVDGPLRVLAIISAPTDVEELDVEAEWARIQEALAPRVDEGLVVIDRLPQATVTELGIWLRRHQTHVIHFVGHGDFDKSLVHQCDESLAHRLTADPVFLCKLRFGKAGHRAQVIPNDAASQNNAKLRTDSFKLIEPPSF